MISIRPADNIAIADLIAHSPVKTNPRANAVLSQCIARSEQSWVGQIDDDVVCVWGLCPPTLLSDQAYIWLLATDEIEDHKFVFIRQSQLQMEQMLEAYPIIVGEVMADNHLARQWIRWLGASFGPKTEDGVIPFKIKKRIK